jgi:hypothetical protein
MPFALCFHSHCLGVSFLPLVRVLAMTAVLGCSSIGNHLGRSIVPARGDHVACFAHKRCRACGLRQSLRNGLIGTMLTVVQGVVYSPSTIVYARALPRWSPSYTVKLVYRYVNNFFEAFKKYLLNITTYA